MSIFKAIKAAIQVSPTWQTINPQLQEQMLASIEISSDLEKQQFLDMLEQSDRTLRRNES